MVLGEARPEKLVNDLSPSKASLMECGLRLVFYCKCITKRQPRMRKANRSVGSVPKVSGISKPQPVEKKQT